MVESKATLFATTAQEVVVVVATQATIDQPPLPTPSQQNIVNLVAEVPLHLNLF